MSELAEKLPPAEAAHAMPRSNSWEMLEAPPNEAPPPYAEVEQSKAYASGCVQLTRGYLITRDWRNNLTVFETLRPERPLYKIKNQYTFLNNLPDVIVTRPDGAPVGVCSIHRSLLAKCQLYCYADEARTQLLASGQRDGIAHRYVFELTQGVDSKRFTWNPTSLLGLGWSYELLDDGGKLVANFENAPLS
ncbi:hypothetical protein AAVH_32835, partial [Aphelenchoides avenae]